MARSGRSSSYLLWLPLVLLALISGIPSAAASERSETLEDHYRVLEWQDLVPAGWEPPVVAAAYDTVTGISIDEASVVTDLDGQLAALPGYMKPVVYEGNRVSEFLLVPFLPHHTKAHTHLEPNQKVYVKPLEPVMVEQPFEPIWIVGALSLEPVMTDEGPTVYRMVEAVMTPYGD